MSNQIAQAFGVEETPLERPERIVSQVPATLDEFTKQLVENKKKDYTQARDNIVNLLRDFQSVVDVAIEEARSNPSARIIEAFSNLAQTYASINKDLIAISDVKEEKARSESLDTPSPVNNVVFVGTSDNLIDQIRKTIK